MEIIILLWGLAALLWSIILAFTHPFIGVPFLILMIGITIWFFNGAKMPKKPKFISEMSDGVRIVILGSVGAVGFIVFVFFTVNYTSSQEDFSELIEYEKALNESEIIRDYSSEEVKIERRRSLTQPGVNYAYYYYQVDVKSNESFENLSVDEKYYAMRDISTLITNSNKDSDIYSGDNIFDCGERQTCFIDRIHFYYDDKAYTMDWEDTDYIHVMKYDNEEYQPEEVKVAYKDSKGTTTIEVETNDTETVVQGKDGHDWINMTDNQKFHAISNGLYNLESNGYTILEGEYYYIDALDSFYDGGDLSASVDRTVVSLGLMSGTIIE